MPPGARCPARRPAPELADDTGRVLGVHQSRRRGADARPGRGRGCAMRRGSPRSASPRSSVMMTSAGVADKDAEKLLALPVRLSAARASFVSACRVSLASKRPTWCALIRAFCSLSFYAIGAQPLCRVLNRSFEVAKIAGGAGAGTVGNMVLGGLACVVPARPWSGRGYAASQHGQRDSRRA